MKSLHKKIFLLIVLAFSVSLVWEVSHSLLYNWNQSPLQNSVEFYIPRILYSTLGDLAFLALMFVVVSLKNWNLRWIENPRGEDYLKLATLGFVIAVLVELRAKSHNLWTYNSLMPTIYGIGITPLIQLAATGIFVLWLIKRQ